MRLLSFLNTFFLDNPSPPLFAVSFNPQANSQDDIEQMQNIFQSNGFQNVSLYALPMKLPTQCVLTQPCVSPIKYTGFGNKGNFPNIHRLLNIGYF